MTDGTGVSVTAGATTGGIDFALDRSGVIAGTVRNDAGAPIASVVVMAYNETGAAGGQSVSDASGSYSIPFLEPGIYYVHTSAALPYLGELYEQALFAILPRDVGHARDREPEPHHQRDRLRPVNRRIDRGNRSAGRGRTASR